MGAILEFPWLGQPNRLVGPDWSGPYGNGLIFASHAGISAHRDMVRGKLGTLIGTKNGAIAGLAARGFGATVGVGSTDKITHAPIPAFAGKRSVLTLFYPLTNTSVAYRLYDRHANRERMSAVTTTTKPLFFGFWNASSSDLGVTFSESATYLNRWNAVLATASQDTVGGLITFNVWLNGVKQTLTTSGSLTGTPDTALGNLDLGNRADGTRCLDGYLPLVAIWDAVLPESAGVDLTANPLTDPFKIFAADGETIYLSAPSGDIAASGGTTAGGSATLTGGTSGEIAASGGTTAGGSATVAATVDVTAAGGTTAGGSATLTSPSSVTIVNTPDRGTIDAAASSVVPNGSTPTINILTRWLYDGASGIRNWFFHVTGVNGLTPVFDISQDLQHAQEIVYTGKFWFSYTGDMDDWTEFANTSDLSSPNAYRVSHSSAFTGDTVYVSMHPPWRVGYTLPWIHSLESSGFISMPTSSAGNDYQFETRTATTNGTGTSGDVIAAQPLYSFKVSNGNALAPDGNAKRKMVLFSGVHACEDVGNYALRGAIEHLVSADAKAAIVRAWFDTYVYPVVSTAGRAGGGTRGDFQTGHKDWDTNRHFDSTGMETVVMHKTAALADAGSAIDVFFDFHGDHNRTTQFAYFYETGAANNATWASAIEAYYPSIISSATGSTTNQYSSSMAINTLGADWAFIPESPFKGNFVAATIKLYGADHMRAVADLITSGEFGTVGGLQASGGTAAGGSATLAGGSGDITAAGGTTAGGSATATATAGAAASGGTAAGGSATLSGGAPGDIAASGGATAGGSATAGATADAAAIGGTTAGGSATLTGGAIGSISASGGATAGGSAILTEVPSLNSGDIALINSLITARLSDIAAAVLAAASAAPIHTNVKKVNDITIAGSGIAPSFNANGTQTDPGDPWVPA